ncbi:MAG: septum formation initiator family protein [Acidimicrobiia bacterium]
MSEPRTTDRDAAARRYTADQVRRRRAIALRASVAALVVVGLLFVVVFPLSAWLDQRSTLGQSERRLQTLQRERKRLDREAARMTTPSEVEKVARDRFGMVRPGEQAYAAGPAPAASTTTSTLPSAP